MFLWKHKNVEKQGPNNTQYLFENVKNWIHFSATVERKAYLLKKRKKDWVKPQPKVSSLKGWEGCSSHLLSHCRKLKSTPGPTRTQNIILRSFISEKSNSWVASSSQLAMPLQGGSFSNWDWLSGFNSLPLFKCNNHKWKYYQHWCHHIISPAINKSNRCKIQK